MFDDGMEVYAAAVAASKKYTDETLGGGGGSQGEKVVIDTDAYGLGILESIFAGGEQKTVYSTADMWETINNNHNCVFLVRGVDVGYYSLPSMARVDNGKVTEVALSLMIPQNGILVTVGIYLSGYAYETGEYSGTTYVYVSVAQP